MNNITFAIIKPDAVKNRNTGKIYDRIMSAGFEIKSAKLLRMTQSQAEGFYAVHKERPFFRDLVKFITSGPVVVQILEAENAISLYRNTMGATNPKEADKGTIRAEHAESIEANSVHGSDSPENAIIEINFFFEEKEIVG